MVVMMTERQFLTALTNKGPGYTYPLVNQNAVTTTEGMMQVAPIPLYFVYDGFDADLDGVCVLERVIAVNPTETDAMTHLKQFLRACLTSHNAQDKKPYSGGTEISAAPSTLARMWAKEAFARIFPTLTAQPSSSGLGVPAPSQDLAALVATITAANQPAAASGPGTSPEQTVDDTKHMSKREMATLLQMCRKSSTGALADLPA